MKICCTLVAFIALFGFKISEKAAPVHRPATVLYPGFSEAPSFYSTADIRLTTDSLNALFDQYCGYKPRISVNRAGTVIITNANLQFFSFSLLDLENSLYAAGTQVDGIEMVACDERTHAPHSWINFNTGTRKVAFIKFNCLERDQLARVHQLILQLRSRVLENMFV